MKFSKSYNNDKWCMEIDLDEFIVRKRNQDSKNVLFCLNVSSPINVTDFIPIVCIIIGIFACVYFISKKIKY